MPKEIVNTTVHTKEILLHAIGESEVGRGRKERKKHGLGEKKGTIPMIVGIGLSLQTPSNIALLFKKEWKSHQLV